MLRIGLDGLGEDRLGGPRTGKSGKAWLWQARVILGVSGHGMFRRGSAEMVWAGQGAVWQGCPRQAKVWLGMVSEGEAWR